MSQRGQSRAAAARGALQGPREAAAVVVEDRLPPRAERRRRAPPAGAGEKPSGAGSPRMSTISDARQLAHGPVRQGEQAVAPRAAVGPALQVRRGRAEQHHRLGRARAHQRRVAGRGSAASPPACRRSRAPRRRRSRPGRARARTAPSAARRPGAPRPPPPPRARGTARPAASPLWIAAATGPKRATMRATVCGVSAISGSRKIALRPRASASPITRR